MDQSSFLSGDASPLALAHILLSYPREHLEMLTEALIVAQDMQDGDLDLEPNGDERDGSLAEDEFCPHNAGTVPGPGCPLSDPDIAIDDGPCDTIDEDLEAEEELTPDYGINQTHALPDAFVITSDRNAMRPHRERIRRDRCIKLQRADRFGRTYELAHPGEPLRSATRQGLAATK